MVTGEEHESVLLGTLYALSSIQRPHTGISRYLSFRARAVGPRFPLSHREKTKFRELKVRKTHHRVCVVSSSGTVANELRIRPQIANLDL